MIICAGMGQASGLAVRNCGTNARLEQDDFRVGQVRQGRHHISLVEGSSRLCRDVGRYAHVPTAEPRREGEVQQYHAAPESDDSEGLGCCG